MIRYISQAWLVLLLAAVFGGALAGVHVGLKPRIEANKKMEILRRVPQLVIGYEKAAAAEKVTAVPEENLVRILGDGGRSGFEVSAGKVLDLPRGGGTYVVYQAREARGKIVAGYVARVTGQGFADAIEILVGFGSFGQELTSIYILDQKETPGVGNKITARKFTRQFDGLPIGELLADAQTGATYHGKQVLRAVKGTAGSGMRDGSIDAVSGATVSSRAVCTIVNRAIEAVTRDWNTGRLSTFEYPTDAEDDR